MQRQFKVDKIALYNAIKQVKKGGDDDKCSQLVHGLLPHFSCT